MTGEVYHQAGPVASFGRKFDHIKLLFPERFSNKCRIQLIPEKDIFQHKFIGIIEIVG
jgi:hypothetical protein